MANAAVVLAVGAGPKVEASSVTLTSRTTSPAFARVEFGLPVMTMSLMPCSLKWGSSFKISSVSPLFGDRKDQVVFTHHAEVAVHSVAGMEKKRRRSSAGQRGGDLLANHAGFARHR